MKWPIIMLLLIVSIPGCGPRSSQEGNVTGPEETRVVADQPLKGTGRGEERSAKERERVAAKIRQLGGKVTDQKLFDNPAIAITLTKTKITDADLADLKVFPNLTVLFLTDTAVTDEGLKHL